MNNIVPLRAGQMPAHFQSVANLPDMNAAAQAGISAGFAVIGYKGRNWRIKHGGNEEMVKDDRGAPVPSLEVVIVGVSPHVSKIWYEKRFVEGDDAAPDCWSVDGITPDPSAPKLQSTACATCPRAVWGSRITDAGKKGKECQDSRRIAVVPYGDIENADYGGPMLLRIPPMSLSNLSAYASEIKRFGAQPYMVRTELSFNFDVAYPELTFKALGWLDADDAVQVTEQMANPLVERILHDAEGATPPVQTASTAVLAGGPPAHLAASQDAPDPQVEMARLRAEQQAAAEAQAHAQAQAQAKRDAEAQAAAQAAQAAAAPKKGGFGAKKPAVAAVASTMPTTVVQHAAAPAENAPRPEPITTVQPAPDDMEAAIDALLG